MTRKTRVVILDDEEAIRAVLSLELQERGYEAIAFASKAEGYDWIAGHLPDLIISDIKSPGMHGFQFLTWVRANPRTAHIPFLFVTGYASLKVAVEAKHMGADDFISKPCDLEDLLTTTERVLREAGTRVPCSEQADSVEFRPWPMVEQSVRRLLSLVQARIASLEPTCEWCLDFVVEAGHELIGVRFCRPMNRKSPAPEQILEYRRMLDARCLNLGLLYTVSTGEKPRHGLDTLLGISMRDLSAQDEFPGLTKPFAAYFHVNKLQKANQISFRECTEQLFSELLRMNGKRFAVPYGGGEYQGITTTFDTHTGVRFRGKSEKQTWFLEIESVWQIFAELWSSERVSVRSSPATSLEETYFLHLLSMLPSVDTDGTSIFLRSIIHPIRHRPLVAILDDEETFIGMLSQALGKQGIYTTGFCYKDEFLRKLPSLCPDVIITDIAAPGMDGLEFLEVFKADKRYSSTPVIVLSGNIPRLIDEATERGADVCFPKPTDFSELFEAVRRYLAME